MAEIEPFFEAVLKTALQSSFLRQIAGKYHYPKEEEDTLREVISRVVTAARKEAAWQWIKGRQDEEYIVLMTLGREVDRLQDQYSAEGLLTESYMVEVIAGDLLLEGYRAFNEWVKQAGYGNVKRYYFFGSDSRHPLLDIPKYLKEFQLSVRCNQAYCITPRKSVIFAAELTEDPNVVCPGICVGCDRAECPNRMHGNWQTKLANLPDGPLPYGYAKILGR